MDKVILTDVDGVLLDWELGFRPWIARQGYTFDERCAGNYSINQRYNIPDGKGMALVDKFNHSSDFENLKAIGDSVEYVQRLHNEGWKFVAITTAGEHPWTWPLRRRNLDKVFGEGVIEELYVLPIHGNKGVELTKFTGRGLYWIEDKPSNAELAYKYGLKPLLMSADHNANYMGKVPRVNTWEEIYRIING